MSNALPSAPPAPPPPPRGTPRASAAAASGSRVAIGPVAFQQRPPRIVLAAVEGWGKTTFGAFAPHPVILKAEGESGYDTLLGQGLVPQCDGSNITDWQQLLDSLDWLADNGGYQTVVLDALRGFEKLCHNAVCQREYEGEWGEKGFTSYQKGYKVAVNDWMHLIARLDRCHTKQGMAVILLSHTTVAAFKNPVAADYDRYTPDVSKETWAPTCGWADAVLFGTFVATIEKKKGDAKQKAIGDDKRRVYCTQSPGYIAKNRYGMPDLIDIPDDHTQVFSTIVSHMQKKGQ